MVRNVGPQLAEGWRTVTGFPHRLFPVMAVHVLIQHPQLTHDHPARTITHAVQGAEHRHHVDGEVAQPDVLIGEQPQVLLVAITPRRESRTRTPAAPTDILSARITSLASGPVLVYCFTTGS